MAAPTPPTGYSSAQMDAIFADLFTRVGDPARTDAMHARTPPELQHFLNYYLGVPPVPAPLFVNVLATAVIKATAGTLMRVLVVAPGTGALTLNNCATVVAASGGNQIVSQGGLRLGQVIGINFPCNTGIVVSAVPVGGQFTVVYT
jgi:hypothetical protein